MDELDPSDPARQPVTQDQLSRLYVLVISIAKAMMRTNSFFGESLIEELEKFRAAGSTIELERDLKALIATVRTWETDHLE
jgi:hypothetical protein